MATKKDLLIGQLAVERGYVTSSQLGNALQKQAELSEVGMQQDLLQVLFTKEYIDADQAKELKAEVERRPRLASAPRKARAPDKATAREAPRDRGPAKDRQKSRPKSRARAPRPKDEKAAPLSRDRQAGKAVRGDRAGRPPPRDRQARTEAEPAYAAPEKSKHGLVIGGIVAGAAVLMTVVIVFFTSNGEEPAPGGEGRKPPTVTTSPAPTERVRMPVEAGPGSTRPRSPKDLVPPGDAARNVLPNGSFDEVVGGRFKRWRVKNGGVRVSVDRDTGNGWCEFPEGGGYLEQKLRLEPDWAEFHVKAVMRCKGLEFGDAPDETFRVSVHFEDAGGEKVGEPPEVPEMIEDADWVDVWAAVPVPRDRGARYMVVRVGNFGSAGVCGVDEIRVIPTKVAKRARPPVIPPELAAKDEALPAERPATPEPVTAPTDDRFQIGYWRFDEGGGTIAGDHSGQEKNGMVFGAKWTAGKQGGALEFDGARAFVEIPGADDTERKSYTLCAWIRPAAGQPDTYGVVVGKGKARLAYARNGSVSLFHVLEGREGEPVHVACTSSLRPGGWYHVSAVVDLEAARAVVYVNGAEMGSAGWDAGLRGKRIQEPWTIGMRLGEDEPFKGAIDEVRIYSRALAAGEVRALCGLGGRPARVEGVVEAPPPATATTRSTSGVTGGRDAILGEFLALVMKGHHPAAEELAKRAAKDPALAEHAEAFRAAARVARAFETRWVYTQRAVDLMAGMKKKFQTVNGPQEGKILSADEDGIKLGRDILVNRQVVGQREASLSWSDLTREQMSELAAGWKPKDADGHVVLAILAATSKRKDKMEAVADALDAAGDHPLIDWVIDLTEEPEAPSGGSKRRSRNEGRGVAGRSTSEKAVSARGGVGPGPGADSAADEVAARTPNATRRSKSRGAGDGLLGSYYRSKDLEGEAVTRVDAEIRFDWGEGPPVPGIRQDGFSVRWTGQVVAPVTGTYTFYVRSDDGSRLWIDRDLIVDQWREHWAVEEAGQAALRAGVFHSIRLEYYDSAGTALCELRWSGPGLLKQIVPKDRLYSEGGAEWRTRTKMAVEPEAPRKLEGSTPAAGQVRGLVGRWRFDEGEGPTANDSSGRGNHGTIHGASWTRGRTGGALSFDGMDAYVAIPSESQFDLTREISVTAWIKVPVFTRPWQAIVTKGDRSWRLQRNMGTGAVCFHVDASYPILANGSVAIDDGVWRHVAGVYDGSSVKLYVDGRLDASVAGRGTIATNDFPVFIGENAERPDRCFRGIIDDVRIYDRALSADEVKLLARGV